MREPNFSSCSSCGGSLSDDHADGICGDCRNNTDDIATVADPALQNNDNPVFIGPYRLLSLIGEGGMGQVFIAEQKKPIRRKVALKIIKPGMDSKEILARFEAERQAVALMDHAHIARVYDAGTTDDGRPFFVMELVEGKPLNEYCDQRKLSLKRRLDLFRQICGAVQHAHQKGIIHRDLKPSNILVATDPGKDDQPVPKIIDFGVAKALGPGLTEHTLYTMAGQILGTPQYMSPEQATFGANDIDTRSDIYSLGVLLYELLTGSTPLEMAELKKAGLDAVLQSIREKEALRPSTKLNALEGDTQTHIADARQVQPSKLTQTLRGDLDWIVMKALEKERNRRYDTANAFSADIQRYLEDEPVLASPPSQRYKLRKFARRNKAVLGAAASVFLVLIGGIATTAWQAKQAQEEKQRAQEARVEAEKLVTFMVKDLRTKLEDVGRLELMVDVESAIRSYYETVPGDQRDEASEAQRASILIQASGTYEAQGRISDSKIAAEQAIEIYESLSEQNPESVDYLESLANLHRWLAYIVQQEDDLVSGKLHEEKALQIIEQIPPEDLSDTGKWVRAILLRNQVSEMLRSGQSRELAKELSLKILEMCLKQIELDPGGRSWREQTAYAIATCEAAEADIDPLWAIYDNPGTYSEIMDSLINENPENYDQKFDLLLSLQRQGNLNNLESSYQAMELARELAAHDPSNLDWQFQAASVEFSIGSTLGEGGRLVEADKMLATVEERLSPLLEQENIPRSFRGFYAVLMTYRGFTSSRLNRRSLAAEQQKKAVAAYEELLKLDPDDSGMLAELSIALLRLSGSIEASQQEKLTILQRSYEVAEKAYEISNGYGYPTTALYYAAGSLSTKYLALGEYSQAIKYNDRSLDMTEDWYEEGRDPANLRQRGTILREWGKEEEAKAAYREAIVVWRAIIGDPDQGTYRDIGHYLLRTAEAVRSLLDLSAPDDTEAVAEAEEMLEFLVTHLAEVHPEFHQLPATLRAISSLNAKLGKRALERGMPEEFGTLIGSAVSFRLEWLPKVEDSSRRQTMLKDLATFIWDRERDFRESEGTGSALSKEHALAILDLCESGERPLSKTSEHNRANQLPLIASRSLAWRSMETASGNEASKWLTRAEDLLVSYWPEPTEDALWLRPLTVYLRELGSVSAEAGNPKRAESCFKQSLQWLETLCSSGGENEIANLIELAKTSEEFTRFLSTRGTPEKDRFDPMKQRADAYLAASKLGDRKHNSPLVISLVSLGKLEQRLFDRETAGKRFHVACEIVASMNEEDLARLSGSAKGHYANALEGLGEFSAKRKEWEKAETYYRESLDAWLIPGTSMGTPGHLLAERIKVRLAALYRESGRKDDPQREIWMSEAYETLHPLAESGKLHDSLKWVYNVAKNNQSE